MAHKTSRSLAITSPTIRGAYFYIHEKRNKNADKSPIPEADQKYEFVGLIPKTNPDPAQCANYRLFSDLAMSAVQGQEEWRGNWPAGGNWPIKDGDDPVKSQKYPWQKGCWVINFSTNYQPKVCILQNGARTEIPARRIGAEDLYKSGDYCIISTYAFTYDNKVRGVKFDVEGVLFVAPGEIIGTASRTVDQMFGSAAIPQGAGMPSAPIPPVAPVAAPPAAPAPQYAAPPAAPVAAPQYAPPVAPAPASPAPQYAPPASPGPAYSAPPMPPSAPGLPPIPGR